MFGFSCTLLTLSDYFGEAGLLHYYIRHFNCVPLVILTRLYHIRRLLAALPLLKHIILPYYLSDVQ